MAAATITFTDRTPEIRRTSNDTLIYRKNGRKVSRRTLEIIKGLHIPKEYKTLWVSKDPSEFLQVVALDSKGRKQYFYSRKWILQQDLFKLRKMYKVAQRLPELQKQIRQDCCRHTFGKARVIAFMLRIMQLTNIRIGNKKYYDKYQSHGLSTLKKDHLRIRHGTLQLKFVGKHGVKHSIQVKDSKIVRFVNELYNHNTNVDRWLFAFQSPNDHQFYRVSADMVNEYLHEATSNDGRRAAITCKDFRTLNANTYFLKLLRSKPIGDSKQLSRNINEAIQEVCSHLNNTASVCKKSYIFREILDLYLSHPLFIQRNYLLDILKLAWKKSRKK